MDYNTLKQYIDSNLTIRAISEKQNLSVATVRYWLNKYSLRTSGKRDLKFCKLTGIDWNAFQMAHDSGLGWRELRLEFNLSMASIRKASNLGYFRSRSHSESAKLAHRTGRYNYDVYKTDKFRKNASKFGGYKPNSGRGIGNWIKNISGDNIYLQSSYETNLAIILNKCEILWLRPKPFAYFMNEKPRQYFPDFYIPKYDLYIDTKNKFLIQKDAKKIQSVKSENNINLIVLSKEQINCDYLLTLMPNETRLLNLKITDEDYQTWKTLKPS